MEYEFSQFFFELWNASSARLSVNYGILVQPIYLSFSVVFVVSQIFLGGHLLLMNCP